nr:MAG TPA: hypothetical protein [Caudoviricetes sp.]
MDFNQLSKVANILGMPSASSLSIDSSRKLEDAEYGF